MKILFRNPVFFAISGNCLFRKGIKIRGQNLFCAHFQSGNPENSRSGTEIQYAVAFFQIFFQRKETELRRFMLSRTEACTGIQRNYKFSLLRFFLLPARLNKKLSHTEAMEKILPGIHPVLVFRLGNGYFTTSNLRVLRHFAKLSL